MRIILVLAPLIGLVWGTSAKQVKLGVSVGAAIGAGNLLMWHIYNAITNRLGLDTVVNFGVNLILFVVVGVLIGVVYAIKSQGAEPAPETDQENRTP